MMKKITKLTKTLLVAAGLLVGTSAWAQKEYASAFVQNYSGSDYANGWSAATASRVGWAQYTRTDIDVAEKTALLVFHNGNNNGASSTYSSLTNVSAYTSSTDWKIEFDAAFQGCYGTTSNVNASLVLNTSGGKNITFTITGIKNKGVGYNGTLSYNGTTLGKFYQDNDNHEYNKASLSSENAATSFVLTKVYHVVITGDETNGVNLTITGDLKDASNADATSLTAQVSSDFERITTFVFNTNRNGGQQAMLDNLTVSINIEQYKTRANTAMADYNSIKNAVMNPSEKTALDAANTALAAYSDNDAIAADISGYVAATLALETANTNAKTSIDGFAVLNDLINNAGSVSGYSAPTGAETTFTANPAEDVNLTTLTAAVRAAIITAGTANENTDITALIANSSFELGSTVGWTTVASDDTGAREQANATYATTGCDGSYLFNTWSQGTPIKQTLGTLPAGQYKVTAKVASNGATVYLTMNDSHNEGVLTSDAAVFIDNEYTFTLGTDAEVTIGLVGGAGDGSFLAEGHWWYKADKFTLTYIGEDPLEQAKIALSNEITAATTVKDSWTPKVGTAPFKYASTYYDVLVAELSEAQAVIDANGDNVDAYTDAKDELETAKNNMGSSELIQPDESKYYRLYAAGTTLNLNALNGSTFNIKLTSAPYAVKIVPVSAGYNITDVYGNIISHNKNNSSSWGANTGVDMRGERITVAVNDDGTITLTSAYASKVISTSSNTENSTLTSGAAYNKWVVSDAVDVTDVNLGVNAAAGWGTFIAPYDNVIPSTVKAYTVSHKDGNTIYFAENETGVLSANTPYILSTEEASNVSVTLKGIANNTEDTYTVNGLVGLLTAGTVPANSYVLQNQPEADGVAFYKATAAMTGTANRCYLDLASVSTTPASARATIGFRFYGDDTTGINSIENAQSATNKYYNLNGQRVAQPQKGFYIVNGKKVIIK